ncbi:MAG: ABC transporter ATP-binding protein/permease [Clostridia bacterium]|jgi:ATP-binding cassette subfamily B protein|nr:ABC transporter ATP-binding protein/permease [Clostridia bacterium]
MMKNIKDTSKSLVKVLKIMWSADKKSSIKYYLVLVLKIMLPITLSYLLKNFVDYLTFNNGKLNLNYAIMFLGSIYLFSSINKYMYSIYYKQYLDYIIRNKVQNEVMYRFVTKISRLDTSQLEDYKVQDLITKTNDTMLYQIPHIIENFMNFAVGLVTFLVVLVILIPYGIWIPVVLMIVNMPKIINKAKLGRVSYSMWGINSSKAKSLNYTRSLLTDKIAIRELKMYNALDNMLAKVKNIQKEVFESYEKPITEYKKKTYLTTIFGYIIMFLIMTYFLQSLIAGSITLGTFLFLRENIERFNEEIESFYNSLTGIHTCSIYAKSYFDFLDIEPVIKISENPIKLDITNGMEIEFENVWFKYPLSERWALKDVSFKIKSGTNFAIVGQNGAGKSTIIKLIYRIYDVTKGKVLINGVDIKNLDLESLNESISILFQDFISYQFTVKDNICMSTYGEESSSRMLKSAQLACADQFVESLPNKFEQQLGKNFESGEELSGGQWQKLAISRVFYKKAPVLIMDEGTSNIDAETEHTIYSNLMKNYEDRTVVVIAHRFSAIKNADEIIVMKDGCLAEKGNHDSLIELNGTYKDMYELQANNYR